MPNSKQARKGKASQKPETRAEMLNRHLSSEVAIPAFASLHMLATKFGSKRIGHICAMNPTHCQLRFAGINFSEMVPWNKVALLFARPHPLSIAGTVRMDQFEALKLSSIIMLLVDDIEYALANLSGFDNRATELNHAVRFLKEAAAHIRESFAIDTYIPDLSDAMANHSANEPMSRVIDQNSMKALGITGIMK